MILALLAAVGSCLAYGVSTVMQAVAARRASGLAVVRQPLVIAAFALDGAAWLLSLLALDHLPLFVVQAVIASSLVVVVLLAARFLAVPVRRVDRAAIGIAVAALVVLAAGSGEQPAVEPPASFTTAMLIAAGVLAAAALAVYRSGHPLLLAVIGGLGYAGAAVAARAAHASGDLLDTVLQPLALVIVVCGVVGALSYLRALERGPVGAAAAVVSVLEVVVPGSIGLLVLGDEIRAGWALAVLLAAGAALAACVVLAVSPANAVASVEHERGPGVS